MLREGVRRLDPQVVLEGRPLGLYQPRAVWHLQRREDDLVRFLSLTQGHDEVGRIRDRTSGEVMHSVSDPIEEARTLYVDQSRVVA